MAGQAHHFRHFAGERVPYGIERYTNEVNRLYGVLERRLAERDFVAGAYSIADIACWPWIVHHARQGQRLEDFPRLARWFGAVRDRPAVKRAFAAGPERMADREAYQYLYGQTAASVAAREAEPAAAT
jgi:GST-like protein